MEIPCGLRKKNKYKHMKRKNNNNILSEFVSNIHKLQYQLGSDPYWQLLFSNGKTKWYYLNISLYNDVYYVSQWISDSANIEIHNKSELKGGQSFGIGSNFVDSKYWNKVFELAIDNINLIIDNPLKAYSTLHSNFPMKYRFGIIQKALLWQFDKEVYRFDNDLSQQEIKQYCRLVEDRTFSKHSSKSIKGLTANKYFELCKIAYISSGLKLNANQKKMNDRELYKQFADGRHDGLLDISGDSAEEFSDWINHKHPKYTGGGHPWEILRGGNTIHISLYVNKSNYGEDNEYIIRLAGNAFNRLCETVKIGLGLYKCGYVVNINSAELIRNRLLGLDYIGIVPEYTSLHRAEQLFETELADVMYLSNIKSRNRQLIELINWKELPFNYAANTLK